MVDPARMHIWAWDARPFPAFPDLGLLWSDAANWETGHWLNGRLEGAPLDRLVETLAASSIPQGGPRRVRTYSALSTATCSTGPCPRARRSNRSPTPSPSIRSSPAARSAFRGARASLRFRSASTTSCRTATASLVRFTRAQESEMPHELALTFGDADNDYATATVLSRRIEGWSQRRTETESAVMTNRALAQQQADIWLEDLWSGRETAEFRLRPDSRGARGRRYRRARCRIGRRATFW